MTNTPSYIEGTIVSVFYKEGYRLARIIKLEKYFQQGTGAGIIGYNFPAKSIRVRFLDNNEIRDYSHIDWNRRLKRATPKEIAKWRSEKEAG